MSRAQILSYTFIFFITLFIFVFFYITTIEGYHLLYIIDQILAPYSNGPAYYSTKNLEWCKELRKNFSIIKQEYIDYCKIKKLSRFSEIDINQSNVDTGNIPWEVLILRVYNKNTNKINNFPKTYEFIEKIPGCTLAMFSVLKPGKHLAPHCGPSKSVLRYHLSLIVPSTSISNNNNGCFLKVNNQDYYWQEGQDVMFDDTYLHSAENNTNETRVVLFLDIKRTYNNIFLDWMNNTLLHYAQYNNTVLNIVENTNNF